MPCVTDDEAATLSFAAGTSSLAEDGGTATITVSLAAGAGETLEAPPIALPLLSDQVGVRGSQYDVD